MVVHLVETSNNIVESLKNTYMIKKILRIIIFSIVLLILSILVWFKFILSEFDEFKNSTFLEHRKHISNDGPYIIKKNDSIHFIQVIQDNKEFKIISEKKQIENFDKKFMVSVYNYDKPTEYSFKVELMDSLKTPQSEFKVNGDIFAISDIEGNFYAFQKLLKAVNIIDNEFNWIFKNNHLVLIGDFVDRGLNVTQCLWLIYKLEQQAETQGGGVHFINGNHETMNLSGKTYHVRSKYKILANKLGLDYSTDLLGENSELGKWLRTKNVIEKINGNLFTHGGISPELISLNLSLETINNKVREYYGQNKDYISKDSLAYFLYSVDGPLWYRKNTRGISENIQNEMNKVLNCYSVNRLIIGHSTTSDIKGKHKNTLYNIDVHFPHTDSDKNRGKGLLMKQDNIYKIDDNGIKTKLE